MTVWRIAIVGAGPAGLYCIDAMKKRDIPFQIDVFDRLPTPYGLLRGGVAPDHQKMKRLESFYEKLLADERVNFYGNVVVGTDISMQTLKNYYDSIVVACGAESDKPLPIPGHDLPGHYAATQLVGWYNGHPDYSELKWDFSAESVVIIGQGNVAIDVARLLAKTRAELAQSDMPEPMIEALATSAIRDIHLVGRRGPVQAAFTHMELQELGELADCQVVINPDDLKLSAACQAELSDNRKAQKNMAVLEALAAAPVRETKTRIHIHFFKNPRELVGTDAVTAFGWTQTQLVDGRAVLTDIQGDIPCSMVFRSVGYRGVPVPQLPFDVSRGVIPNTAGRVDAASVPGVYVTGWIKRGPTGVLGSNKPDSEETIATMVDDGIQEAAVIPDTQHLLSVLEAKGVRVVTESDWYAIKAAEEAAGQVLNKPREKKITRADLLDCLSS